MISTLTKETIDLVIGRKRLAHAHLAKISKRRHADGSHDVDVDSKEFRLFVQKWGQKKKPVGPVPKPMLKTGPALWKKLHDYLPIADLATLDAWIAKEITPFVSCGECRKHWLELLERHPPPKTSNREAIAWGVFVHDEVNDRAGHPRMGLKALSLYPAPPATHVDLVAHGGLGDVTALSGTLRDLHLAHPHITVDLQAWNAALFEACPNVRTAIFRSPRPIYKSKLGPAEFGIEVNTPEYGDGNTHLQVLFTRKLEHLLGVQIPITKIGGDLRLTDAEKAWQAPWRTDIPVCILNAGSKEDFQVKQCDPREIQKVVDHYAGRIQFVQVGGRHHFHPRIRGAFDFVRDESPESVWRDFRWTMVAIYRAQLVISPISWPVHLAAALETPDGSTRAAVVLHGGSENPNLTMYPNHQILSTVGELDCCRTGNCSKMKLEPGGGASCLDIVSAPEGRQGRLPRCMTLLTAERIIAAIEETL